MSDILTRAKHVLVTQHGSRMHCSYACSSLVGVHWSEMVRVPRYMAVRNYTPCKRCH